MATETRTAGTITLVDSGTSNEKDFSSTTASDYAAAGGGSGAVTPFHDNGAFQTPVKSKILRCTNFGFTIDPGDTLTTLTGIIRKGWPSGIYYGGTIVADSLVRIRDAGGYLDSNRASSADWVEGLADEGYMFSVSGFTAAEMLDAGFGIDVQITGGYDGPDSIPTGASVPSAVIDLIQLTVSTEGSPGGSGPDPGGASFSNMGNFRRIPEIPVRSY